MTVDAVERRFVASRSSGEVGALWLAPRNATACLVFAHGAGAGMRHPFMEAVARRLAERGIATFRYEFPYMEKKSRRPDPRPILLATVRSAVGAAAEEAGERPLFVGGKSMGGRMSSLAAADEPFPPRVRGLVFFGFPLHPAGQPSTERADHLANVTLRMLFLQGTRDTLADLDLLRPVCDRLGARATLHVIDGADHSFHVPKRSGRADADVLDELADVVRAWAERSA